MNQEIIIEMPPCAAKGQIAVIKLNRPDSLNALSHAMCLGIRQQLRAWADDDNILAVIIASTTPRAFCAGGDIRHIYTLGQQDLSAARQFFTDEYAMNQELYHFPKPFIACLDGLTMGGGAGISIHGSHPIATERMQFAMPETRIGFFPDVGMSYHLVRLAHHLGYYLGLTGATIGAGDCLKAGLVKAIVPSAELSVLIQAILAYPNFTHKECHAQIDNIISGFANHTIQGSLLPEKQAAIDHCFEKHTLGDIINTLASYNDSWAEETLAQLKQNSPTSLYWTMRVLQETKYMTLDDVIRRDESLSHHLLTSHDLYEGVRAMLIDKDKHPKWQPSDISAVRGDLTA